MIETTKKTKENVLTKKVKPLAGRPKVASVVVTVDIGIIDPQYNQPQPTVTSIKFEGVSDVDYLGWLDYESVILKFGNQSDPSDWYTIFNVAAPNSNVSAPTFTPLGNPVFNAIEYVTQGIAPKLLKAYEDGVQTVPLRLQNIGEDPIFISLNFSYFPGV